MSNPSIAVVGAGVAGLSTALRAAELGCEVTVIEREHPAAGSSGLSAGVFNINSTELLQVEVRVQTRALLDRFERENGLHLARIGYLRLARNESHVAMFEEVVALQRELGVEPSRIVDPARAKQIVPHLRTDDLVAAIHNPRDGHMDGPLLCGVLAERAEAAGATVLHRTRVSGHQRAGGRHRLLTSAGEVEADVVVNAAGPWAAEVGELLGRPLPLVNQLHEVIKVQLPPAVDYTVPMVQEYIPGEEEAGYFRQDGPSSMIAGMHTYAALDRLGSADPDDYRRSVTWDTWEAVAKHVSERLVVDGLGLRDRLDRPLPDRRRRRVRGRALRGRPQRDRLRRLRRPGPHRRRLGRPARRRVGGPRRAPQPAGCHRLAARPARSARRRRGGVAVGVSPEPRLLVTNDDGIAAEGLHALTRGLAAAALPALVLAPSENRSGVSRNASYGRPVALERLSSVEGIPHFSCQGMPVDCVRVGMLGELAAAAELVVSGINHGPNLGDDTLNSGTVGAAIEGALLGASRPGRLPAALRRPLPHPRRLRPDHARLRDHGRDRRPLRGGDAGAPGSAAGAAQRQRPRHRARAAGRGDQARPPLLPA